VLSHLNGAETVDTVSQNLLQMLATYQTA